MPDRSPPDRGGRPTVGSQAVAALDTAAAEDGGLAVTGVTEFVSLVTSSPQQARRARSQRLMALAIGVRMKPKCASDRRISRDAVVLGPIARRVRYPDVRHPELSEGFAAEPSCAQHTGGETLAGCRPS